MSAHWYAYLCGVVGYIAGITYGAAKTTGIADFLLSVACVAIVTLTVVVCERWVKK